MSRRNLLLATTTPPPTTALQFPVYLVEGDNGQVGIDLYNWLETNLDNWNPDTQQVFICDYFVFNIYKSSFYGNGYVLASKIPRDNVLYPTGIIIQNTGGGGGAD